MWVSGLGARRGTGRGKRRPTVRRGRHCCTRQTARRRGPQAGRFGAHGSILSSRTSRTSPAIIGQHRYRHRMCQRPAAPAGKRSRFSCPSLAQYPANLRIRQTREASFVECGHERCRSMWKRSWSCRKRRRSCASRCRLHDFRVLCASGRMVPVRVENGRGIFSMHDVMRIHRLLDRARRVHDAGLLARAKTRAALVAARA